MQPSIQMHSTVICPHCGYQEEEEMPEDACQFFWECPKCDEVIKPKQGDCCVFCSYGSNPCPPVQIKDNV